MIDTIRQLFYFNYSFFKQIFVFFLYKNIKNRNRMVFCLAYFINTFFLGKFVFLYTGKFFRKIRIGVFFLCMRFGVFSFTRRFFKFITNSKISKLSLLQKKR